MPPPPVTALKNLGVIEEGEEPVGDSESGRSSSRHSNGAGAAGGGAEAGGGGGTFSLVVLAPTEALLLAGCVSFLPSRF